MATMTKVVIYFTVTCWNCYFHNYIFLFVDKQNYSFFANLPNNTTHSHQFSTQKDKTKILFVQIGMKLNNLRIFV